MSPETIDAMLAAGVTAEVLAAAWKAEIAKQEEDINYRRARDAERQRRHRESHDVTVTERESQADASPQSPPLKAPPDPLKITPPLTPQPLKDLSARAFRLPGDWQPMPLVGKAATMIAAWKAGELERELAKFKNYWFAKGGKDAAKRDWQRTWINWLISADERKPRNERTDSLTGNAIGKALAWQRSAHAGTG